MLTHSLPMTRILCLRGTILTQSIQMQLSKKQKSFYQFVFAFLEFRLNGENFEKKEKIRFSKVGDCDRRA